MYKPQFDQYIRVLKHGRMLAYFDPVIGLVGFGHVSSNRGKEDYCIPEREVL
jgi:hypothetical protein